MSTTPCATDLRVAAAVDQLPQAALDLFADPHQGPGVAAFYDSAPWYRLIEQTALPSRAQPHHLTLWQLGQPVALLPMLRLQDGSLSSLTTPYSCAHRPLLSHNAIPAEQAGLLAARAVRGCKGLRLEAIDARWPDLASFCAGLRQGGLVLLRFGHFGNWCEAVPDGSFASYLAGRDGALRETIRRRTNRLLREEGVRLEMLADGPDLARGIAAFETVYAKSWKRAEPYPAFNQAMIRLCAQLGLLRLAVLWRCDVPVAVQYWIVANGTASVLKLAHDMAEDRASPGTVLSAWAIRQMMEHEKITLLDFGRGDDPYKRQWASTRNPHIGIMAANPRHPSGALLIARHMAGRLRHWLREDVIAP